MKFRTSYFAVLLPLTTFLLFAAQAQAEDIRDFAASASFQGRNMTVEENIRYDFGEFDRHGIYRYIPDSYNRDGMHYRLRLRLQQVLRNGQKEKYSVNNWGGDFSIKIGDPKSTISGVQEYALKYSTDRAINFFPDHDELYWNVTGNGWSVPMDRATYRLRLPGGAAYTQAECFTGTFGSTEHACDIEEVGDDVLVATNRVLLAGEGLTVVLAFPPGTFPKPSSLEKVWMVVTDNAVLFFPLAALVVMFLMWRAKGRDPSLGTVIPEYESPRKWPPAMIAAAETNGSVPDRAVTATILDLARRGFVKIRFGEQKGLFSTSQTYTFVKQKDFEASAAEFEDKIFEGLFKSGPEAEIKDLKDGKFYTSVQSFKTRVQTRLDKENVFTANPMKVRSAYIAIGVFVSVGLFVFFSSTFLGAVCAAVTGVIILLFGWFMPRRTLDGVKLLAQIKGFKWFLSVTEKDRLDFHNAPERTPEQFMEFLPYAVAFGVEQKWAEQFKSLTIPPPQWAEGNFHGFNAVLLASGLHNLHSSASSAAFSPPSSAGSGGSGFSGGGSGGGFGGGGGGSW